MGGEYLTRGDFCTGLHLCLIIVQLHLIRSNTLLTLLVVHGYAYISVYRIDVCCMFGVYGFVCFV